MTDRSGHRGFGGMGRFPGENLAVGAGLRDIRKAADRALQHGEGVQFAVLGCQSRCFVSLMAKG